DPEQGADGAYGIQPVGPLVLPLLADARAARQQPELHVLAQRRFAQRNAVGTAQVDQRARGQARLILAFQTREDAIVNPNHGCYPGCTSARHEAVAGCVKAQRKRRATSGAFAGKNWSSINPRRTRLDSIATRLA